MSLAGRDAAVADDAPLVVFDFDHTLYRGDSGGHLFRWMATRTWWRRLLALLVAPVAAPMIAFLPTRRHGIGAFVWVGTVGFHRRRDLDALIDRYVAGHADRLRARLLPTALAVLHRHREAGFDQPIAIAYSDSSADLPLLKAAAHPVVVNPKADRVDLFRRVLPPGTPILNWDCAGRAGDPVPPAQSPRSFTNRNDPSA